MSRPMPRRLASSQCVESLCLLIVLALLVLSDRIMAGPREDVPTDWWSAVQQDIAASEYRINWQENSPLADVQGAWLGANRAQNLRTYFTPEGIRTIPRTIASGEAPPWEWGLSLVAWGCAGAMMPAAPTAPCTNGNRVEYNRGALTEWYVNDARGLEQGFTVLERLNAKNSTSRDGLLRLELAVTGTVTATLTNGCDAVEFLAPGGALAIRFSELHAFDSAGAMLPAHFETDGACLVFVVDDTSATYPITIDPLATSPNWTAESDQASAYFGSYVSTAGDVNGDGYSDVIVGAYFYDNGQTDEGRAFVYHGSMAGLSATANWTAESDQDNANFGLPVATAGDVNGDGYTDVIVGARLYDNGHTDEGRAYVFHGSAAGLSATANWTAEGDQASAYFGSYVSTAGDVNGDGYSDIIVGAWQYDNGQADEGRAFVYLGSSVGLSATANWVAESDQAVAYFGRSVATAGDVNGDGYSDVIIGAHFYDNGQANEGRAFVYHGSAAGLSAAANWTAEANQASAYFGVSVATAEDVNGDGYSDVIVGAYFFDNGQTDEGRAFVYYGSAAGLSATASWTAESDQAGSWFGFSVSTAGDVNGDDYSDVIIGARLYDNDQSEEGRVFVYHGSAAGLSAAANWIAEGDQADATFGTSVSTAGDVNGDGYSDVIISAYLYDNGQLNEGRVFVYHGSAGPCAVILGDMNCDCALNIVDVSAFVLALIDPAGYATAYPGCDILRGDMQPDGTLNGADVPGFVDLLVP